MGLFNSRDEYVKVLDKFELSVYNKLYKIKGINYWPIIRIQVGYLLHLEYVTKNKLQLSNHYIPHHPSEINFKKFCITIFKIIGILPILWFYKFKNTKKFKNKTLFVGFNAHNYQLNKESINIYLHPFIETKNSSIIFYLDEEKMATMPQKYFNVLERYYKSQVLCSNYINGNNLKQTAENATLSNKVLNSITNTSIIGIDKLVYNALTEHCLYTKIFLKWLKTLQPNAVQTYCYYNNQTNALIFAANKLKITTIEYQHSTISHYHFAYKKWYYIQDYINFFPKKFYAWNNYFANLIRNNFESAIVTEVTGNKWAQNFLHQKNFSKNINNNILITLQGLWIPKWLENFIEEDNTYKWYFRMHPRYPNDRDKLIALEKKYPLKVVVKEANEGVIFDILGKVNTLITLYSGTVLDALQLGKKIIVYGEEGYSTYQQYIMDGSIMHVNNEKELKNILKENY